MAKAKGLQLLPQKVEWGWRWSPEYGISAVGYCRAGRACTLRLLGKTDKPLLLPYQLCELGQVP